MALADKFSGRLPLYRDSVFPVLSLANPEGHHGATKLGALESLGALGVRKELRLIPTNKKRRQLLFAASPRVPLPLP